MTRNSTEDNAHKVVLIVTSKGDYTADYVILKMRTLGVPLVRFNTEDFPSSIEGTFTINRGRTSSGEWCLKFGDRHVDQNTILGVWYRRPGRPDLSQFALDNSDCSWAIRECEAWLRGLWENLGDHIVSLPSAIRRAEEKPLQLRLASKLGLEVPETIISNSPHILKHAVQESENWVVKPLWSGAYASLDAEEAIWCEEAGDSVLKAEDNELRCAPIILQRRIDKVCDSRVTFIGDEAFAVKIRVSNNAVGVDWRRASRTDLSYELYELPVDIADKCREMLLSLGLRFGAFDFALDHAGCHYFLEVNPNGQWAWLELATGIPMSTALINLLSGK